MRSSTGIEELARLLGVAVGQQLRGALEVGKQHRDLLALAFQGAREVRIFSARCRGVYDCGEANRDAAVGGPGAAASAAPQLSQKLAPRLDFRTAARAKALR